MTIDFGKLEGCMSETCGTDVALQARRAHYWVSLVVTKCETVGRLPLSFTLKYACRLHQ